jgi:hypothetical protein
MTAEVKVARLGKLQQVDRGKLETCVPHDKPLPLWDSRVNVVSDIE